MNTKKVELLAPGGNLEKLKIALTYGADAVYISGKKFGLRAGADNFIDSDMIEGIKFAHDIGKKVFVAANAIPHNDDLLGMPDYVEKIIKSGADAIILSDPGVYAIVREISQDFPVHISTQANNVNWKSAEFWHSLGAKRIILARELSISEIAQIRQKTSSSLQLEIFVHGAMCISYSGRCLLSNYMVHRDANRGNCAHPCRWKYRLIEEKNPNEEMEIHEDQRGTYIFNSKDLCTIQNIPELIESGVSSFKLEGRMKSSYYVACVVRSYRAAIDSYYRDLDGYKFNPDWLEELHKISNRQFTTGFYFEKPTNESNNYKTGQYSQTYDFVGMILDYNSDTRLAKVQQRNNMKIGDRIEVITPSGEEFEYTIFTMMDKNKQSIEVAPHAQMIVYMPMENNVPCYSLLRRKKIEIF